MINFVAEDELEKVRMNEESLNLRLSFNDSPRASEQSVLSPIGNLSWYIFPYEVGVLL